MLVSWWSSTTFKDEHCTHQAIKKEVNEEEKHRFRSGMGTLLYLCQDHIDIQHAARRLSQWMSKPKGLLETCDPLPEGTSDYGLLLPYQVKNNSKTHEILQREQGHGCDQRS